MSHEIELSILIAAHREGLIAHKTMLSVERALKELPKLNYEIIVTIDNGDEFTKQYFANYHALPIRVFEIDVQDLAASRNFALSKSRGEYVATLDADDLVSKNWFKSALEQLKDEKKSTVIHTHYSVNFGTKDIVWEKFNSRSMEEDATIMVWANRWDSAIVTQAKVLKDFPYQSNSKGFGSEDWHFNSNTLAAGIPHLVSPETVLFVRRKDVSEMTIQATDRRTLHYTNLLSINAIHHFSTNKYHDEKIHKVRSSRVAAIEVKAAIKKIAKPLHAQIKNHSSVYRNFIASHRENKAEANQRFPQWLLDEWRLIHAIEKQIFPTKELLSSIELYHSEMYDVGNRFMAIMGQFSEEPDYIIFTPSLVRGGAELVVLNYITSLKNIHPKWKIAVVATENLDAPWKGRLPEGTDYVEFGRYTESLSEEMKLTLLARLIVQSKAKKIHIAQSGLAFKFAQLYQKFLEDYLVYAFAFCEDKDNEGRISGHIHSGLALAYASINHIFTDNRYVIDQLANEYSFDPNKFTVLYQPQTTTTKSPIVHSRKKLRILWASRVSKQKRPDILIGVARKISHIDAEIDFYGLMQDGYTLENFNNILNLNYKGEFASVLDIPVDEYDVFLYTSENDGVPNILIEMSSAGLPIIAPRIGGIPEILQSSPLLVEDFESSSEYVDKIVAFTKTVAEDRKNITLSVQHTIASQHNWEVFKNAIKSVLNPTE